MNCLVYTDLHLKPAGSDYDLEEIAVPSDVDLALVVGDLTHRAGPDDVDLARQFIERVQSKVPVVYVPGNHDHSPMDVEVTDPFTNAYTGHNEVFDLGDLTLVGWGCERRSLSEPLDQCAFEALDSRDVPHSERRYAADSVADDLETACFDAICGDASATAIAERLGIQRSERASFERGLDEIATTFEHLSALLADEEDVLLTSHLSPFNTSFDRHHSVGAREEDREHLHSGSIALKLAISEHDVFATFSGHSHAHGYEIGNGDDGRPHSLNLGFRSVGTVMVDPESGVFSFSVVE